MITRAAIEDRLTTLRVQQENLIADVNALAGAIQDCEYWLTQLADGDDDAERGASEDRACR